MPKRKRTAGGVDEKIRSMALRFAADITRLVRDGISDEVSAQIASVIETVSRGSGSSAIRLAVNGVGTGDRRLGKKPVPVVCPVPGCKNVGIRAKRNFCVDHAASLSEAEKNRLREAQTATKAEPRGKPKAQAAKKRSRKEGKEKPAT